MPAVKQTSCCALYEMHGVHGELPTDQGVKQAVEQAKTISYPKGTMPVIIFFTDNPSGYGQKWQEFLIKQGYKVDSFEMGKNKKSGNKVTIFHWYPEKTKTPSMVREYEYGQKPVEPRRFSKLGGASGEGARAPRFLRGR